MMNSTAPDKGAASQGAQPSELFFVEHNRDVALAKETIIFLHGAFGSHHEWDHVVKHFLGTAEERRQQYHVIIPDQLGHARSRVSAGASPSPRQPLFAIDTAADAVAALIRTRARNGGRAHVVGLSLGGFVAQALVCRHPDLVLSLLITGATPFTPAQMWLARHSTGLHWGLWVVMSSGFYRFSAWRAGLVEHEELQKDMWENNRTAELANGVYAELARWGWEDVAGVGRAVVAGGGRLRVLICAGGAGDNLDGTRRMVKVIRQEGMGGGEEREDVVGCRGFVIKDALHGWHLQFPELFASSVRAWIENAALPAELEVLE